MTVPFLVFQFVTYLAEKYCPFRNRLRIYNYMQMPAAPALCVTINAPVGTATVYIHSVV